MTVKNEQGQDKDRRDREGQSRNTKYRTEGRRTQQIKEGQDRREKECTVGGKTGQNYEGMYTLQE